ncbi:MAG: E3 binding domain-containing protein, partial [Propionibacteriaceae bacterium]|nr:E3 binding domain-containing protein [Propionibacteriaceae bacterium]
MATTVVMPQLGNTVESCLLAAWRVAVGDSVDAATVLCDIETDKSAMEVPAGVAGTVLALLAAVDDDVPVKAPIAVIGRPGEAVPDAPTADPATPVTPTVPPAPAPAAGRPARAARAPSTAAAPVTPTATPAAPAAPAESAAPAGPALASPRAKALAAAHGLSPATLTGTGPDGLVTERDVQAALAASPGLTRAAQAHSGALPTGPGSALGGRTALADLADQAAPSPTATPATAPATAGPGERDLPFPGPSTDTPLKGVRQIIADRMLASLATSAQLTYTATADATALLALRSRFKAADPAWGLSHVTLGDLVGYAFVRTLARHPG